MGKKLTAGLERLYSERRPSSGWRSEEPSRSSSLSLCRIQPFGKPQRTDPSLAKSVLPSGYLIGATCCGRTDTNGSYRSLLNGRPAAVEQRCRRLTCFERLAGNNNEMYSRRRSDRTSSAVPPAIDLIL